MTKTLISFFTMLSLFATAQQTGWKYITTDNNTKYYYKSSNYNTAWTKEISKKIEYYPPGSKTTKIIDGYQITLIKYDCDSKKLGIGQISTYSKTGKVLKTVRINDYSIEMNYVIPDSIGESLLDSFCSK